MNRKLRRAARGGRGATPATALRLPQAVGIGTYLDATEHYSRGNQYRERGQLTKAMESYVRAIEIAPNFMDAHLKFCSVLIAQSRHAQAAAYCEQILSHDPMLAAAHFYLAVARSGTGDTAGAYAAASQSLKINETPEARLLLGHCLQNLPSVADDADTRELIVRAMSEPWGRPGELAQHCVSLIKADCEIAACIDRAVAAWPARLNFDTLFGSAGLAAVSQDRVLRCLLENTRIADVALERFLTSARGILLELACAGQNVDDDALGFFYALARQCFINEYIFAHADDELQLATELRRRLFTSLRADTTISSLLLAAVAAYFPLHALENAEWLLALDWPPSVDALLTQQVREPMEELRLRPGISRLTPVEDEISLRVRQQYEENPYPRWVKTAPSGNASEINARLFGQFPYSSFRHIGTTDTVDVLVAGCGTGQQVVDVAMRIAGARVLAIDLSLPSLCYAKRQTDALGLRNIEYGQADILQLAAIDRTFDVIDCAGVLHHLGDPLAGWRTLLSVLRPHGVMRVALYSDLARRHIVAARQFAVEQGLGARPDDIRAFRQKMFVLPDTHQAKRAATIPDFFSVSECRDLVFHVQEHRFTLPQIKDFLAASDLNVIGFEVGQHINNQYSARFPQDRARTDLDLWHRFEQGNPATFAGMYQFWVQRRTAGG